MSTNFFEVRKGINLDNTQTSAVSVKGDIAYNTSTDKLELFDGAVDPIVAETKAATLTNKSISGSSNTLTNIPTSALTGTVSLTTQVSGVLPVANGGTNTTTSTGTGNVVLSTSPTLITPALGTPTALVGTNITGTASGFTAGNVTTNANLTGPITSSGNATSIASQTGTGSTFVMSVSPSLTGTTNTTALTSTGLITASAGIVTPAGQLARFNGSLSGAALSVANATGVGTTLFQAQIAGVSSGIQIASDNSNNMDYKFNSGVSNTTVFEISDVSTSISAHYAVVFNNAVSTPSYQTSSPSSAGTITCTANLPGILLTPAGTLATLTIKLPSSPIDGQQFWVASSQILSAVTWQDAGGTAGNVVGGQATIGGTNRGQSFVYSSANTKWYSFN